MSGSPVILLAALLLDAALGEPQWIWSRVPHPAVMIGRLIGRADDRFNRGDFRRLKGTATMAALVLGAGLFGVFLQSLVPGRWLDVVLVAVLLAQRSLVQHVAAVATALRQDLSAGRSAVAMIVGRDTSAMDEPAVARAAIESAAENLSDGVIAPAFWYLVGGLPGLLIYKVANTADSMIGHRTPRHEAFGWAAARFDDVLNWIPARLTAGFILLAYGRARVWPKVRRDAALHRSPNAGWPESAMARSLGIALSGPRSYDGQMRNFPFINRSGNRTPGPDDIARAVQALWRSWGIGCALVVLLAIL